MLKKGICVKSSIVNIESVTNSSFGTGFVVHNDAKGVYILTCKHVVEEVVNPVVENILAKVVAMGDFIDMAVLYVPKLQLQALPLEKEKNANLDVAVIGFSHFNQSSIQKKHIDATLFKELIELHAKEENVFYNLRKIKAKDGFNFDRGNSGSPVICLESNKVIAMISNKEGTDLAYAINIEYIKDIWKEIPPELFTKPNSVKEIITPYIENTNKSNHKFGKYFMFFFVIVGLGFYLFQPNGNAESKNSSTIKNRTINYESGDEYKGEAKEYQGEYVPEGKGTFSYFNGNKYVGIFKNGKHHGKGTLFYNNGNKYIGMFINGMPNGKGTAYYHTDDKYIGIFKDGKRNGTGTFYYKDGDSCKGTFKNDLPDRKMICTLFEGFKVEVFYKDGLPTGDLIFSNIYGDTQKLKVTDLDKDFNDDEMVTINLYD